MYRVPGPNKKTFINNLDEIYGKIEMETKSIIIGTDQNLDLLNASRNNKTQDFCNMNLGHGLIPTILSI